MRGDGPDPTQDGGELSQNKVSHECDKAAIGGSNGGHTEREGARGGARGRGTGKQDKGMEGIAQGTTAAVMFSTYGKDLISGHTTHAMSHVSISISISISMSMSISNVCVCVCVCMCVCVCV